MTKANKVREELIEYLDTQCIDSYGELQSCQVADFILARDKKRKITLNRERLAKNIYISSNRFNIGLEDIDNIFNAHYTTWNPKVNEAFVIADAILSSLLDLVEVVE